MVTQFTQLIQLIWPVVSTRSKQQDLSKYLKRERDKALNTLIGRLFHASIILHANENWRTLLKHIGLTSL